MLHRHWYKADWILVIPVILLTLIGVIMMFSTSSIIGFSHFDDPYFFVKRHFIFLCMGIVACFVGFLIPHRLYKHYSVLGYLAMIVLLLLTLTPLGVKIGGAQRWLNLGFIRFQPVEFAKLICVVIIAMSLERPVTFMKSFIKGCFPILAMVSMPLCFLLLQPDLGNTGLIIMVLLSLFFLSSIPMRHLMSLGAIAVGAISIVIANHPYQLARITAFLDPWADPLGKNYHVVQSLIAIGSGGITGLGLGESKLKYFYLPLQYSDFIFSVICEEGGFILATIVIGLYAFFLLRCYHIVRQSSSDYSFYLGMGLGLMIVLQAFLNIAVVIGVFPVTGIPLTFISFGGTSLITSLFFVGIILNISKTNSLKEYEVQQQSQ